MKILSVVALVVAVVSSQAQSVVSTLEATQIRTANLSDKTVSVNLQRVSLETALKEIAAQAGVQIGFADEVTSYKRPVSVKVDRVSLGLAFSVLLKSTGLVAVEIPGKNRFVVKNETQGKARNIGQGVITGKVTDAKTGRGISGATISVASNTQSASSAEDGSYGLTGIVAGVQTITVRLVGYAKQTRSITVTDGATVIADFKLEASANVLDQVVVTGTAVATELKAVPTAITVITAKQIEERGITKIDQLFRGEVPGLFAMNLGSGTLLDEVTMFSRGATALPTSNAGAALGTNPIKTYIDGVELMNPKYMSQIDPKSIDRIEILTGPQASTIYGSNAINGVMQIFTKRGSATRPQFNLSLLSGWVENNFSNARTPQHDYSAQLNGIEGKLSYNAGGSWQYLGPWTPAKQQSRWGGFGGARLESQSTVGRLTADMTLRRTTTQSIQRGEPQQPLIEQRALGWSFPNVVTALGVRPPRTNTLAGQTLGITLTYLPVSWWSHELGIGSDVSNVDMRVTGSGYTTFQDTALFIYQEFKERRSVHYTTTTHIPVASFAQATVTAGGDAWQTLASTLTAVPQTLTGSLAGSISATREPGHNSGGFIQTQLGLKERLFLTYGLRAEWNPSFGEEAEPNYAPRYGVAYTQDIGVLTAKFRGSYGRSTRPPAPRLKRATSISEFNGSSWPSISGSYLPYYGDFNQYLPNADLVPEHQQGGEGGIELYLGARGSLVVTRYNQTVDGLILDMIVDSVRSSTPCSSPCQFNSIDTDGYGYQWQSQYLNIGSIRNQGWELQGTVNAGPFTTRGTYSWTKSRVIGLTPKYQAVFAGVQGFSPGDTFRWLPEHTWALGLTYARSASAISLNFAGPGQTAISANDFSVRYLHSSIRLPQNRQRMTTTGYVNFNKGYALGDLTASHRFAPKIEGVLQIQNLTDDYTNDNSSLNASMGRNLRIGARIRSF